jgi:hypothetical protein
MPLVRYFVVTGGLLLGLLLVLTWYVPASPAPTASPEIDRSTIRIHSSRKWPEAVQIDTRVPIVATAPPATETPLVASGPSNTDAPAAGALPAGVKEAYASEPSPARKPSATTHHHTRVARAASSRKTRRFASSRAPEWNSWFLASW